MDTESTLLWVSDDPAVDRCLVEGAAAEFDLVVRFCGYAELADLVRTGRWTLVALEAEAERGDALETVGRLAGFVPRPGILVAARGGDIALVRRALEAGADDVVSLPLDGDELRKALVKLRRAGARPAMARQASGEVITLCGGRGGIGVTTAAVNLAFQLGALTDAEVALLDLDLQRGDVAAFLNLAPADSLATLAAADGEADALFLAGTLTRHPDGVFVLAAPAEIEEADAIGHDDVARALGLLRAQFRYTIVDTARTITGATVAAFEQSAHVLLVSDLSIPGIRAARRLRDLLERLGVPPSAVGLLVTEAVPGPVSVTDAARAIGREPLLVIPRDAAAFDAMNEGTPLNGRQTPLPAAMAQLAAKLAGVVRPARRRPSGLRRLFARAGRIGA
jgi:pilus assembly protein CpaE